ncbi:MAG TPA: phosphatase PAP2 family protein [Pseudomonas sp.]|nr:phosphatase PAP2 family protein [Pseudomonas sp.]
MDKITLKTEDLTLPILARLGRLEYRLCITINRLSRRQAMHRLFRTVSRLGDGVFWYCLMAALALFAGEAGREAALRMGIAGLSGLLLYRQLKHRLVRERPFITFQDIRCGCPPLDRFSFPSGHTLHAVSFTTLALAYFPLLGVLLVPFAALVALSRPVLGLHYPSDVLCGALLGYSIAQLVLMV